MLRNRILPLLLVGTVALGACGGNDDDGANSDAGPQGTESFDGLSRNHTSGPVDYPQSPPVGGDHDPAWQNCGIYLEPVRNENAVHALEHGAVWISYAPDLPEEDVAVLREVAEGQSHVLMAPYPGLRAPVVLTAWGKQLAVDAVDDPRIEEFVEAFQEGPQTPEPGAPCEGGIGRPDA